MKYFQIHLELKSWLYLIIFVSCLRWTNSIKFKPSPCPGKFNYESTTNDDRWYGDITFPVNKSIEGSSIRIGLDRPSQLLSTTAGPITSEENKIYIITHDDAVLEKGSTYKLIFMVKFDKGNEIPMLETIHFNGQRICPPDPATLALGGGNDYSTPRPDIKATAPTDVLSDIDKKPKNPTRTTTQATYTNNFGGGNTGNQGTNGYNPGNSNFGGSNSGNQANNGYNPSSTNFGGGSNSGNQGNTDYNSGTSNTFGGGNNSGNQGNSGYNPSTSNFGGGSNSGNQGNSGYNPSTSNFGGGSNSGNQGNTAYNPSTSNTFGGSSNSGNQGNGYNPSTSNSGGGSNSGNQGNTGYNPSTSNTFGGSSNSGNQGNGYNPSTSNSGGGSNSGNQGNNGYNPSTSNNFGGSNNGFNNNQGNNGVGTSNSNNFGTGTGGTLGNNGFNTGNQDTSDFGPNSNSNQQNGFNSGNSNTFGTNGNINQGNNGFSNNQGNSGTGGGSQGNKNPNQGGDIFNNGGGTNNGFTGRPNIGNEATVSGQVACGTVSIANPLITLAQNSEYGQWPWHVALFMRDEVNPSKSSYICGGSLVSKNRVITAAHCVSLTGNKIVNPNSLTAYMGKYNINTDESTSQKRAISGFKVNPEYNKANFHNDIAILNLNEDVEYTNYVRPICLWEEADGIQDVVGQNGYVVGWGYNEHEQLNTELKQATMPIVSTEKCARSDPQFFSEYVSENAFCAGSLNGTGPCKGDSGGGLVVKRNSSWYLRGIVSVSAAPKKGSVCNNHQYIVFTDTAKYSDFIRRNI